MEQKSQRANEKVQVLRAYYLSRGRLSKDDEQSDNTIIMSSVSRTDIFSPSEKIIELVCVLLLLVCVSSGSTS